MKKFLLYFFAFIFVCFLLPAILTKQNIPVSTQESEKSEENEVQEKQEESKYDYKKYGTINLLHKKTGEVEKVELDTYLCNVVSAEMPVDYEFEALKAQAIVARTYTIYEALNKKHDNADICDDSTCCQAWISKETRLSKWDENKRQSNWEKIEKCVNETKGKIVTYENKPINAFFHSNSGGKTELPVNVWGGSNLPYLQVVETSGEDNYSQYSSEAEFTNDELIEKLKTKYADIQIDFTNNEDIKILEYTDSRKNKNS